MAHNDVVSPGILTSWFVNGTERKCVQTREWILTAAVIVVPLIIAAVVTLWSLEQVRYRPKKRRPVAGKETAEDVEESGRGKSKEISD